VLKIAYSSRQKLDFNSILDNVLNERHRNFHSAKQKQRKKALFWCSKLDLTDRTHLRVQYTNSCGLNNPVQKKIYFFVGVFLDPTTGDTKAKISPKNWLKIFLYVEELEIFRV
jgi:hypothetical protein